jgi:putative copper resistance protein D
VTTAEVADTGATTVGTTTPARAVRVAAAAVPVAVLLALGLLVATGQVEQPQQGLPDPGTVVRLGLPVVRTLQDLAAALTVGLLVAAVLFIPPASKSVAADLVGHRARAVRLAAISSTVWLFAGVATLILTYADVAGIAPTSPEFTQQLGYFLRSFDLGRAMLASLVVVALVSIGTMLATRINTAAWLAYGSLVALLPLALSGHAAGSDDHQAAVDSLAVHLVTVCLWAGGVAALVVLSPWLKDGLGVPTRRFSTLAGWCFVLVAGSGLLNAWLRLGSLSALATPYGGLVLAKAGLLVLLGAAGWQHRRSTLPAIDAGSRSAFLRLAAVEVVLMGAAVGVAVALSRSAPPVSQTVATAGDPVAALLGFPFPPAVTAMKLLTRWYAEPLWLLVAGLGVLWYLRSVVRLHRRGDRWPVGRTVSWVAGCLVLVWATSGGPGVYGRISFTIHMFQHMTLMMVAPLLLVLGAPATLALRTLVPRHDGSRGPREWLLEVLHSRVLRVLAHPVVAAVLFVGSIFVFYYTPLFGLALSTHTGHMLMVLHFVAVGYLFCWVMVGPDPGPPRPAYPIRLLVLLATVTFHAFFGVALMMSGTVLAPDWWSSIGLTDNDALLADQHNGGGLVWGVSEMPTLVLVLIVAYLWSRADDREARTADRQADRDGDAELTAYNARLARLAARDEQEAQRARDRSGR